MKTSGDKVLFVSLITSSYTVWCHNFKCPAFHGTRVKGNRLKALTLGQRIRYIVRRCLPLHSNKSYYHYGGISAYRPIVPGLLRGKHIHH